MSAVYLNAKELSKIFTCRRPDAFADIVTRVMPYKGKSGSHFFECRLHGKPFLVKLTFTKKTAQHPMIVPPIYTPSDTEILILKLLKSKIIDANISPCVLEIYHHRVCTFAAHYAAKQCLREAREIPTTTHGWIRDVFCSSAEGVRAGILYDKFSFILLERCDMTLSEFIRQHVRNDVTFAVLKSMLFQIIHLLYAVTKIYPRFQHNDLHAENVLLKFDIAHSPASERYLRLYVEDTQYTIPYVGVVCKVIDFGMSAIPEASIVSAETHVHEQMYYRVGVDALLLFHEIHRAVYETLLIDETELYRRVVDVLDTLDPTRSYVRLTPEYTREHLAKVPTYERMLASSVFDEYRNAHIDVSLVHHAYATI